MTRSLGSSIVLLALTVVVPASAQTAQRHAAASPPAAPAPAPAARPRVGYAAEPAPQPAPTTAPVYVQAPVYYYYYSPDGYMVSGAPYVVLADGSVLLDFGYGYRRQLRSCEPQSSSGAQASQGGLDALGRIGDPPGIAALKAGARGQATGYAPARNANACYRSNAQGGVEMVTGVSNRR